jgi:uncharacterized protein YprB with RNaseH-like and TPR domain
MSRTKHHRSKNKDMNHAPASYTKWIKKKNKAQVKQAMKHEEFDNIPTFKQDALYTYI